jgi:hypothetical protein
LAIVVALFAIFAGQYVNAVSKITVKQETDRAKKELKAILKFADAIKVYKANPEFAIRLSEEAIPDLTGVELIQAKSNLAYYYAYGPYIQSRDRALSLAKETLVQAFLYPERANNFKVNYGYVVARYAETVPETNKAIDFLEKIKLINSIDADEMKELDEYLEETREKLRQLLS